MTEQRSLRRVKEFFPIKVPVHNAEGKVVDSLELKGEVFGVPRHIAVIHQAVVRQLANGRQGTADTKTRGEVSGGGSKPYRQKGTGRARQGSIRAPQFRGGGVVFGPHPRDYDQALPKKMRRLALRSVLSAKAVDGQLVIVDRLQLDEPKTKKMASILEALGVKSSALIVTAEPDTNVLMSARNLERVKALPAACLSVGDLLSYRSLVMTLDAVHKAEALWA